MYITNFQLRANVIKCLTLWTLTNEDKPPISRQGFRHFQSCISRKKATNVFFRTQAAYINKVSSREFFFLKTCLPLSISSCVEGSYFLIMRCLAPNEDCVRRHTQ